MSLPVGIGVIGMGWMGHVHSRAYMQAAGRFPQCHAAPRLVACCDDVAARAEEGRQRLGFQYATTNWRDVVEDPRVAAVSVTTPNNLHLSVCTAAAAAGKHIFCEKPVGRSPDETLQIAAAARAAGVITWVGFNYRWAPLVQFARRLIEEGALGQVTHYRGRFFVDYGSNPSGALSWRFQHSVAGLGVVGDLMTHAIDSALFLAGPIARVVASRHTFISERPVTAPGQGTHFSTGTGAKAPVTNEDYAAALVSFACGAVGTLETCRVAKGHGCEMAWEIDGTKGSLKWSFERMNELVVHLPDGNPAHAGHAVIQAGPQHPFYAAFYPGPANSMGYEDLKTIETHGFLKSIAEGRQGVPGFEEMAAVARVAGAIERSWLSGKWEEVNG
jgi:predicted dehydrogenase